MEGWGNIGKDSGGNVKRKIGPRQAFRPYRHAKCTDRRVQSDARRTRTTVGTTRLRRLSSSEASQRAVGRIVPGGATWQMPEDNLAVAHVDATLTHDEITTRWQEQSLTCMVAVALRKRSAGKRNARIRVAMRS